MTGGAPASPHGQGALLLPDSAQHLKRRPLNRVWRAALDFEMRAAERCNRAERSGRRADAGGAVARGARATCTAARSASGALRRAAER
jgi:hypothetical protein